METADGKKAIQDVKIGDKVLSKDEATGKQAYKEVEWLFERKVKEIYKIYIGKEVIETTDEHPFWIIGEGWVEAKDLQAGDKLETADGTAITIDKVLVQKKNTTVYNFKVKDYHTYFVSDLNIYTHNACKLNGKAKGTKNPIVKSRATIGQEAHRQLEAEGIANWKPEQTIRLLNGKVVRKDGVSRTNPKLVRIIKPDTPSGRRSAKKRVELMRKNGYETHVDLYNPLDPRFQPGSPSYIGPRMK